MEDSKLELPRAIDTMGGIEKYACCFQITEIEMVKLLTNKTVLDLGSGLGGLAKEATIKHVPTKVFSVNPRIITEATRSKERKYTLELVEDCGKTENVQKKHDDLLTSALGENLPYKNESFDIVFDVMAVTHYSNENNFRKAINEMFRVTKKGGQIYIYADFGAEFDNEKKYIDKRSILKQEGISFRELRENGYGLPKGFKITKPA